ncbi:MAG: hypothetical protein P4M07_01315 [Xanthobacteraceae bacterium]|nr:hypothetical protein [Xanthobacteraceae bacterium]
MRIVASTVLLAGVLDVTLGAGAARAADTFPKFDIQHNCKLETSETSGVGETMESCVGDETRARDELKPKWDGFKKADQTTCLRETSLDGTPSYVELQICLEMTRDSGIND